MNAVACWYCDAPFRPGDEVRIGLHRDAEDQLLGLRKEWKATEVIVPRCHRCRIGHSIDKAAKYVLIGSTAITGVMLLAWGASRLNGEAWTDEWQLILPVAWTAIWLFLWRGIRQHKFTWQWVAPKPERYGREHPTAQHLEAEGWTQRDGPL